ncbi:mitochondrial pyruvate dehydrogenase protein x component-like protein [Apiospora phragmitis]|uniref:Mitochondrial pyruvate dehydrogenase protein x component-like protein n=1 Tax=Apiospora phragmitis TaxID=2905665 RepID=A0ABR1TU92_9PEZI
MAFLATACRLSVRLASRKVTQDVTARGFRTSAASLAAQNFTMPALSPTMTEGNIASWKLKEGESFSAGDVILEIETDKASMDVEAQDDGILMKITQGDGAKGVQVGARIGVLAEPGDDISSLEMPADNSKPAAPKEAKKEPEAAQPKEEKKAAGSSTPKKSGQKAAPQKYPLYPSVEHLIKENGLAESAISEMTPTGPQGRLLKGDVLAYLGKVTDDRPAAIAKRFEHNSHLDLSNIKLAKPAAPAKATKKEPVAEAPKDIQISLSVSLASVIEVQKCIESTIGTFMPLSTFIARAADVANDELPLPSNYKPSADELFNQVLGLNTVSPKVSRGYYLPQVAALPPSSFTGVAPKPKASQMDIIDFLASGTKKSTKTATKQQPSVASGISTGVNTFTLTVSPAEQKRAQAFLTRMKMVLENDPGRLVL